MSKTILTVVGNRPQFIKMAPVSRALARHGVNEIIVHTGQHYDDRLNDIFFRELALKKPDVQLEVIGRSHGAMTGELLVKLEKVFLDYAPQHVLLYGDTNTTLAAAIAAAKLHIGIAHVEAGPRLYDMSMPEEVNRVMVDHVSELLFCPDKASVENLAKEGITQGVYQTGDVMLDAFRLFSERAREGATLMQNPRLKAGEFLLMTLHRPSNVDSAASLRKIYELIEKTPFTVLFPAHPRTLKRMEEFGVRKQFEGLKNLVLTEPLGYLDTVAALAHCRSVLTDSGGLQKEAFYAGKTAIVLLDETPWPDLKASRWQFIAGTAGRMDAQTVLGKMTAMKTPAESPDFYGDGHAADVIVKALADHGFFTAVPASNAV